MWVRVLLVALLATSTFCSEVRTNFRRGLQEYWQDGEISTDFQRFLNTVDLKHAFRTNAEKYIDGGLLCEACVEIIDQIILERQNGLTNENVTDLAIDLCVGLNIERPPVCEGVVRLNVDTVLYILDNRPDLRGINICGIVAQSYGCGGELSEWSINVPEGNTIEKEKGELSDAEPLQVLHLTDIHYDPLYKPNSVANCLDPVCCQSDSGIAENPEDAAGFWGDFRDCDTPLHSVDDALDHINQQHPHIDYVYYTGDIISHRVWDTSKVNNIRDNTLIYTRLRESFPNIPVFPILGNHEPHPVNVFSPTEVTDANLTTQWVFDEAATIWSEWLGADVYETIRKGGYYTVLVRPGFRIIALNSNVAYTFNWWLLYDTVDPFDQLQWLADTLYEAEQNGEFVHIISHVSSSDSSCYQAWSREYRRLIDRFANTITAAFNGHTHSDELIVYHNRDNPTQANSVAWNGGSLTTFSHNNLNYKIYSVDAENYEVIDFESWIYNMTEANLTPDRRPVWYKLYSFKEAYGLSGATPKDVRDLAIRMAADHSLVEQYFRFSVREADTSLELGCDDACLRGLVCSLLRSQALDDTQCDEILENW